MRHLKALNKERSKMQLVNLDRSHYERKRRGLCRAKKLSSSLKENIDQKIIDKIDEGIRPPEEVSETLHSKFFKKSDWTCEDLALHADLDVKTVKSALKSIENKNIYTVTKLAVALEISLDELMFCEEAK